MKVIFTKNIGMLLLGIWLILMGLVGYVPLVASLGILINFLAIAAGVLVLIGGWRPRSARPSNHPPGNLAGRRKAETTAPLLEPELETLNRLGLALAGQLDMERLVKAGTDAGLAITGPAIGAL